MQKGQRMRPPSRTALNGPSRPRISLSLSCSHLSDHLSICSGERCDDDNDSDYGYHSVCLVTQGLHRRSQLILTTSPFYSHPTQSLSAHCVPGTVLGPGNPLVNEADKGPCRQGAQILEMRKLRSKEYLCVSAGPPPPTPTSGAELGTGTPLCLHPGTGRGGVEMRGELRKPGSCPGSTSDKQREIEPQFPQLYHGVGVEAVALDVTSAPCPVVTFHASSGGAVLFSAGLLRYSSPAEQFTPS